MIKLVEVNSLQSITSIHHVNKQMNMAMEQIKVGYIPYFLLATKFIYTITSSLISFDASFDYHWWPASALDLTVPARASRPALSLLTKLVLG